MFRDAIFYPSQLLSDEKSKFVKTLFLWVVSLGGFSGCGRIAAQPGRFG